uniref:Uncharacterized protein n=1 Tax=Noccaea caerulescens TaxID=107243 RepID=A0A1J3H5B6_NOCCA
MVTPGLLAIRVHQTTDEGPRVHLTTEEAIYVHHMVIGAIQDLCPRRIGSDHTQGQAQGPGMSREAEARVPDTEGDLQRPDQVMMETGDGVWCGVTLSELVMLHY